MVLSVPCSHPSVLDEELRHVHAVQDHLGQLGSCQAGNSGEDVQGAGNLMSQTSRDPEDRRRRFRVRRDGGTAALWPMELRGLRVYITILCPDRISH